MKATDLMLGDWVAYDSAPSQVTMTSAEGVEMVLKEGMIVFTNSERLKPIPLTGESLKLNGFNCSCSWLELLNCITTYVTKINETNNLVLNKINKQFYIVLYEGVVEINYIHELQHLLRLCGKKDLADNFKVE